MLDSLGYLRVQIYVLGKKHAVRLTIQSKNECDTVGLVHGV